MYVDGFLIAIPKKNLAAYKKMALLGKKIWMKHGALDYKECVGDDLEAMGMDGKPNAMNFIKAAGLKKDEVAVFSYIVFKSKAHRNAVNKKVMKDPKMQPEAFKDEKMPFEMDRFSYGGFKVLVGA